jgi:hypothetical protein
VSEPHPYCQECDEPLDWCIHGDGSGWTAAGAPEIRSRTERERIADLLVSILADPQMQKIMGAIDAAGGPGNITRERADQIVQDLQENE